MAMHLCLPKTNGLATPVTWGLGDLNQYNVILEITGILGVQMIHLSI